MTSKVKSSKMQRCICGEKVRRGGNSAMHRKLLSKLPVLGMSRTRGGRHPCV